MAQQHLFRRNATYYFRRVVPRQFIPFFHHKEIRFSLKTTSLETAKRKLHCINVQLDTFFSKIDRSLKINRDRTHKDGGYEMHFNKLNAMLLANEYSEQSNSENKKSSEEILKTYLEKTESPEEIQKMMASYKSDHISDEGLSSYSGESKHSPNESLSPIIFGFLYFFSASLIGSQPARIRISFIKRNIGIAS